ncbi:hypothetical protein RF11_09487 [Thelohanellus kitauei]|uniref:Uncharacterized protein n=1 Tax=Thelohanellus kitauei TaxID=669202 RepID=A0A0C2N1S4_THEKT|nr:hypothetical protein RF11_09487 [Thelohanellus kitauei]
MDNNFESLRSQGSPTIFLKYLVKFVIVGDEYLVVAHKCICFKLDSHKKQINFSLLISSFVFPNSVQPKYRPLFWAIFVQVTQSIAFSSNFYSRASKLAFRNYGGDIKDEVVEFHLFALK